MADILALFFPSGLVFAGFDMTFIVELALLVIFVFFVFDLLHTFFVSVFRRSS